MFATKLTDITHWPASYHLLMSSCHHSFLSCCPFVILSVWQLVNLLACGLFSLQILKLASLLPYIIPLSKLFFLFSHSFPIWWNMFLSQLKIDRPIGTEADLGSAQINCFWLVKSSSCTFLLCVFSTVKVLCTSPGYPDTIPSFSDIRGWFLLCYTG